MGRKKRAKGVPSRVKRPSVAADLGAQIAQLHRLYGDVDAHELRLVHSIRAFGGSWADVGQAFGIGGPSAFRRFGKRVL